VSESRVSETAMALRRWTWWLGAPVRLVLLGGIAVYRVTLSGILGGRCRFEPSCSTYARDAIARRGAARGTALAAWRVLRCSPFSRGGFDPVPMDGRRRTYESLIRPGGTRA
jgi:putative membrane protein insertion efficiency factor